MCMKSRHELGKLTAYALASLVLLLPNWSHAQDGFALDPSGLISLSPSNPKPATKVELPPPPPPAPMETAVSHPSSDTSDAISGVAALDLLSGDVPLEAPPSNATKPHASPAAPLPPPPRPDSQTEASFTTECTTCHPEVAAHHTSIEKLPINKVAGLEEDDRGNYHSSAEKCYSQALLSTAKKWAPHRDHSVGKCARGVRTFLNHAGIYGDYSDGLGDAIDYHVYGKLKALGFKNFIDQYPTPYAAPAGAILVFAGPYLTDYLRNGKSHISRRGGRLLGDWLGHITVKGDNGLYYTDGRTREPAIGWPRNRKRRRLVGVYLMEHCTAACSQQLRNRCGGL